MCAEQCGKDSPAAHGARCATALLHILVCFVRIWCAKLRASVGSGSAGTSSAGPNCAACALRRFCHHREQALQGQRPTAARHVGAGHASGNTHRHVVLRILGTLSTHLALASPAPDAAPALQLTINGTANLAAAQREAAASNSSYEIVRHAASTFALQRSRTSFIGAGGESPVLHGHYGLRCRLRALLRRRTPRLAGLAHRRPRGACLGRCRRRSERDSRERAVVHEGACRWRSQRRSGEAQRARRCAGSARCASWLGLGTAAGSGLSGGHHRRGRLPGHFPQRRLCRGARLLCAPRVRAL